jgi:pyruvate/2-oxoglutarate dehydrogenase complex dihydrolipoamide acyltransferase (E2) component
MAVQPVIMPKLGAYTEDVLLTEWLVEEGEEVAAGAVVFELETDKTTAEVEAETSGWLHRLVAVGEKIPIGASVGLIAETREEYEAVARASAGTSTEDNPFLGYISQGGGTAVARAAVVAGGSRSKDAPSTPLTPARPGSTGTGGGVPLVSPRARALLTRLGYSLDHAREIIGSGPGGRITDRDVAEWAATPAGSVQSQTAASAGSAELTVQHTIPLRGRRGTIAARMVSSLQTAAQLTSVLEIEVKSLVELRARLNESGATPPVGITSIVVKLVAAALREHPLLNARVTETDVELLAEINVAVAVETSDGLVAPVVAGADRLSLAEINERIVDLASRARDGSLMPADVAGGTFTVSNGGINPVDITTAILNPPQCGILWIGRIRDRPVVVADGAIAARPTLQACLTFDHRAIDGGPAAAFLTTLQALVADLPRLPS